MRKAYPVILSKGNDYIVVHVPDFQIGTQGVDVADAMFMARDAIGLVGIDMEDNGDKLPEPSDIFAIQKSAKPGDIVTLVDVDFTEYRKNSI